MEDKERRLTAMHPSMVGIWDNANSRWNGSNGLNGWEMASATVLYHETEIDLSGYAMDSLTFFPSSVGLQDPGIYNFLPQTIIPDAPLQGLNVLDIISSVPMDPLEVMTAMNAFPTNSGPGLIGSKYEFTTILFGMFRFFTANTNVPYPGFVQLQRSQRFDSGEATAADRLYCYRIVQTLQQDLVDGDSLGIPAARQLIAGVLSEEKELVYMQRLRRSYELANQL
jgi:hypothetical protein